MTPADPLPFSAAAERARDAQWGPRRPADVANEATRTGLGLEQRLAMPANTLLPAFRHAGAAPAC